MLRHAPVKPDAWTRPAVFALGAAVAALALVACCGCYSTATVIASADVGKQALDGSDQVIEAPGKALGQAYAQARANIVALAKAAILAKLAAGQLTPAQAVEALDLVAAKLEQSFRSEQGWRDLAADARRSNDRGREALGYASEMARSTALLQDRVDALVEQAIAQAAPILARPKEPEPAEPAPVEDPHQ